MIFLLGKVHPYTPERRQFLGRRFEHRAALAAASRARPSASTRSAISIGDFVNPAAMAGVGLCALCERTQLYQKK